MTGMIADYIFENFLKKVISHQRNKKGTGKRAGEHRINV